MTAGRQGGAAEATQRLWRPAEEGHRGVTRQSLKALIAVCHVVESEPTHSKIKLESAWRPNEAVKYRCSGRSMRGMGLISIHLNLGFGSKRKAGEMHVPHHAAHAAAHGPCKLPS